MTGLNELDMYRIPKLTGTIPLSIDTLLGFDGQLLRLLLHDPGIVGTLPVMNESISLSQLFAFNTGLSGQLPSLPSSMQLVHLHNCGFSGTLPPLGHLTFLENLTLFNNAIGGHVELPPQVSGQCIIA